MKKNPASFLSWSLIASVQRVQRPLSLTINILKKLGNRPLLWLAPALVHPRKKACKPFTFFLYTAPGNKKLLIG